MSSRGKAQAPLSFPAKAGIQYAAASPYPNAVSGILGRPVKPGDDSGGAPSNIRSEVHGLVEQHA
ncbi:hypothetical protein DCM78_10105 [Bradyrhizobium sp. WBOS04]|nr:hypothetical protein DCM78_10105 [Bradyrhizobium sp. WBOS04]UUO60862.1 hypothetical protein DCM80_17845 [Bradyrhizobium sp. WBOS08]